MKEIKKNELLSQMSLKGYTQPMMAEELSISRQSFNYKLNGKRPFNGDEISMMAHLLGLTPSQVMKIFFEN